MPIRNLGDARPVGIGMGANVWPALGEKAMDLTGDIVQQENARENAAINAFYKIWLEADSPEQLKALQDSPNFSRVVQSAQRLGLPVEQDPAVPGNLRFPYGPTIRGIQDREKIANTPQLPGGLTPDKIQEFDPEALAAARAQAGPNGQPMPTASEAQLTASRGKVQRPKWNGIFREPSGWNTFHQAGLAGDKASGAPPAIPEDWQKAMREQGIDPRKVYLDLQAGNITKEQVFEIANPQQESELTYKYMEKEYPGRYKMGPEGKVIDRGTGQPVSSPAEELKKVPVFGPMMYQEYIKNGQLSRESLGILATDVFANMGLFPGVDPKELRSKMDQIRAGHGDWVQMASGAFGHQYASIGKFMLEVQAQKGEKDTTEQNIIKLVEMANKSAEDVQKSLIDYQKLIMDGAKPEILQDALAGFTTKAVASIDAGRKLKGGKSIDLPGLFTPTFSAITNMALKPLGMPVTKEDKSDLITNRFMNFNLAVNQLPEKERETMFRQGLQAANNSTVPFVMVDKQSWANKNIDTPMGVVLDDQYYAKLFGDMTNPWLIIPATAFKISPIDMAQWTRNVNQDFLRRNVKSFEFDPSGMPTRSTITSGVSPKLPGRL